MELPHFLFEKGTRIKLPVAEPLLGPEALLDSGAGGLHVGDEKKLALTWENFGTRYSPLPFHIILQDSARENWCWAAVTLAVMQYYNDRKGQPPLLLTQEQLVRNRTGSLKDEPLEMHKALGDFYAQFLLAPTDIIYLQNEIVTGKRPVCLTIRWYIGGAHFVVIYGLDLAYPGSPLLYVMDPRSSTPVKMTYQQLLRGYLGDGTWRETHFTTGQRRVTV